MFRLLAILCTCLFLVLLIGGRDTGQTRPGLQGAYEIAALKEPPPEVSTPAADLAEAAPAPAATAPRPVAPTQVSFARSDAPEARAGITPGLTLSQPLIRPQAAPAPEAATVEQPSVLRVGRILGNRVNVREGPSAKAAVLGRLARDEVVTVIATEESGWSLVRIEGDGIEGYVATRYLSDAAASGTLFASE